MNLHAHKSNQFHIAHIKALMNNIHCLMIVVRDSNSCLNNFLHYMDYYSQQQLNTDRLNYPALDNIWYRKNLNNINHCSHNYLQGFYFT